MQHGYVEYYAPDYRLHLDAAPMENLNDREYLDRCKTTIFANLGNLVGAPSVQLQYVRGPRACVALSGRRQSAQLRRSPSDWLFL